MTACIPDDPSYCFCPLAETEGELESRSPISTSPAGALRLLMLTGYRRKEITKGFDAVDAPGPGDRQCQHPWASPR